MFTLVIFFSHYQAMLEDLASDYGMLVFSFRLMNVTYMCEPVTPILLAYPEEKDVE